MKIRAFRAVLAGGLAQINASALFENRGVDVLKLDLTQYCSLSLYHDINASAYTNAVSAQLHGALGRMAALSWLACRSSHKVNFASSPYEANVY